MVDAAELRRRCAEEIDALPGGGYFQGRSWLRAAFLALPREAFVPDLVWSGTAGKDGSHPVLDRTRRPERWLKAVYRPLTALITQVADGAVRPEDGPTTAPFTSSLSCAAVTVDMLHHLDPRPGDRVLEIGTGTGYSTALLAARVGAGNVVSVEIDEEIAGRAAANLHALGIRPRLVVGDGELGHAEGAPYDRILSTVAVRRVPPAWPEQLRAGGVLLTPLDTPYGHAALCRMVGDGRGGAAGRLVKGVFFMVARGQREQPTFRESGWPLYPQHEIAVDAAGQRVRVLPGP
ncbi:methyltransferase domain-containing protein [Streptomyces sp. NPDC003077]|uniref:methyltransferase domain-containing protein n=1 Tax=Streptomyces sp. NPDC003077 TaxID=3154443 RepID=UPI0033A2AC7A